MEFTAVFREVPEGYVAFVEELPAANPRDLEVPSRDRERNSSYD
jgi:hypothetical protein